MEALQEKEQEEMFQTFVVTYGNVMACTPVVPCMDAIPAALEDLLSSRHTWPPVKL